MIFAHCAAGRVGNLVCNWLFSYAVFSMENISFLHPVLRMIIGSSAAVAWSTDDIYFYLVPLEPPTLPYCSSPLSFNSADLLRAMTITMCPAALTGTGRYWKPNVAFVTTSETRRVEGGYDAARTHHPSITLVYLRTHAEVVRETCTKTGSDEENNRCKLPRVAQ